MCLQKAEKPAPVLTVRSLSVNRGSTVKINQNTLRIDDAIPPNYLVITINSLPDEGKLLISSGKCVNLITFTIDVWFHKLIKLNDTHKLFYSLFLFMCFRVNKAHLVIVCLQKTRELLSLSFGVLEIYNFQKHLSHSKLYKLLNANWQRASLVCQS